MGLQEQKREQKWSEWACDGQQTCAKGALETLFKNVLMKIALLFFHCNYIISLFKFQFLHLQK